MRDLKAVLGRILKITLIAKKNAKMVIGAFTYFNFRKLKGLGMFFYTYGVQTLRVYF